MKRGRTDYDPLSSTSDEARRLLRREELILKVAEAIASSMAEAKVTRSELARRLGRTPAFVTQTLGGGRNLTLGTIAEVADALCQDVRVHLDPSPRRRSKRPPTGGRPRPGSTAL